MTTPDKVTRAEVMELLKLVAHIRAQGLNAIDHGKCPGKQRLRTRLTAGAWALRASLEEVERWTSA